MSKHDEFDDFFGDDDDTPVIDTRAAGRLYRVPLGRLAPNLVNPRTDFGAEDALIDFGKSLARRQNQACPVVSRSAYLKLWPDHAARIGDVDYVLVSGERRYRGANAVGLSALDCVVDDNAAADRKTFMEAVVSENVDRQNFDPVEEAYAVQALVAEFGSNRAVAQHFERVDGWVTQRILLTHLAPDVQTLVRKKAIPLEAARSLGKMARDKSWGTQEQLQWWEEEQERKAAAAAARTAARKQTAQEPAAAPAAAVRPGQPVAESAPPAPASPAPSFTAVKQPEPAPVPPRVPDTALEKEATTPRQDHSAPEPRHAVPSTPGSLLPEARTAPPAASPTDGLAPGKTLPYHDGMFVGQHLILKMPPEELVRAWRLMGEHVAENGLEDTVSSTV